MDTDLAIWVTDCIRSGDHFLLNGDPFDGEFGFGDENRNHYEGRVCLVNATEKKLSGSTSVQTIHVARSTWGWRIECDELISLPFLLSDDPRMEMVFNQTVRTVLTAETREQFVRESYQVFHAVYISSFLGIFSPIDEERANLILFGTGDEPLPRSAEVEFSQFDRTLLGTACLASRAVLLGGK